MVTDYDLLTYCVCSWTCNVPIWHHRRHKRKHNTYYTINKILLHFELCRKDVVTILTCLWCWFWLWSVPSSAYLGLWLQLCFPSIMSNHWPGNLSALHLEKSPSSWESGARFNWTWVLRTSFKVALWGFSYSLKISKNPVV